MVGNIIIYQPGKTITHCNDGCKQYNRFKSSRKESFIYFQSLQMCMSASLRNFIPFQPEEILNGPYGDWIFLLVFISLFIGVSGAVLPKHLTENNRYGKTVVVFCGIILGIGLFKAKDIYNFNLESLGFMAIWLIVFCMGLVVYGLSKMGMNKSTAISVTYCIMFLSFFLLSPSLFDAISQAFPLVNLIFIVLFFYMLAKPFYSIFANKNPLKSAREFRSNHFSSATDVEIEREEKDDLMEIKDIKKKAIPATKKEFKCIKDIKNALEEIIKLIRKKGNQLSEKEKKTITEDLERINKDENILQRAANLLKASIYTYNNHHRKDIAEIQNRLKTIKLNSQKAPIIEELNFHKTMLKIINYMDKVESATEGNFIKSFNNFIFQAMKLLKANKPDESVTYLQASKKNIEEIFGFLKKIKSFEKWLIKIDKKIIEDLDKELKIKSSK
jgi:hypothetical protein